MSKKNKLKPLSEREKSDLRNHLCLGVLSLTLDPKTGTRHIIHNPTGDFYDISSELNDYIESEEFKLFWMAAKASGWPLDVKFISPSPF